MTNPEILVREWFERASRTGIDRLPPERLLAEQLGLSRAALRKGLAALDTKGLLIREVGRGTFLRGSGGPAGGMKPAPSVAMLEARSGASPRHYLAARLLIEPRLAGLAAREASARDLDALELSREQVARAADWDALDAADDGFHRAVAQSSGNPILLDMFERSIEARKTIHWGRLRNRDTFNQFNLDAVVRDHDEIFRAIVDRDGEAAESAMMRHVMVENTTIMV